MAGERAQLNGSAVAMTQNLARAPGRFTAYPVSRSVSSNRSNGPQLLEPLPRDELVGVVDPVTGEVIGDPG